MFSALNLTSAILAALFTEQECNHQKSRKKKTFAEMVIFDAKSGDLILMGFVSLMLFEFVRIPKVREE